jgi:hypothetical protein
MADMPGRAEARVLYFLVLGRKFAADHPSEHVREVAFIALSWASTQRPGQPAPKQRPSQDPNRMELLAISQLIVSADESMKVDGQMVEIIRDNKGKVRDLYHLPATVEGGQSPLLAAFVLGFHHPQWSTSEVWRVLHDLQGPT